MLRSSLLVCGTFFPKKIVHLYRLFRSDMEALLEYGYIGLFLGSFLAATVVPFSSDVLLVGMLLAGGDPVITVAVATLGNWLGGLTS